MARLPLRTTGSGFGATLYPRTASPCPLDGSASAIQGAWLDAVHEQSRGIPSDSVAAPPCGPNERVEAVTAA
jgi:hypothetical protein